MKRNLLPHRMWLIQKKMRQLLMISVMILLSACAGIQTNQDVIAEPEKISAEAYMENNNTDKPIDMSKVENNAILARLASCKRFYGALDLYTKLEQIEDVQDLTLESQPFISVNRFLASFKQELDTVEKQDYWLSQAALLNQQRRLTEWGNLSISSKNIIRQKFLKLTAFEKRLVSCSDEFLKQLTNAQKVTIISLIETRDSYSTVKRFFGIYALTSKIVEKKIKEHQLTTRTVFDTPIDQLPILGSLERYKPDMNTLAFATSVKNENPLNIPYVSSTVLNELFQQYSPILEIDITGDHDRPGYMEISGDGIASVNISKPVVYVMPSYTRFAGKSLLQLNYFVWFSERPFESKYDLYAGKFDGIVWRVTLDENRQPILFDTVHQCGCYHKLYATDSVILDRQAILAEREPPFVAQENLQPKSNQPWVLRISSKKHFVQRVYQDDRFDKGAVSYQLTNYNSLRSLVRTTKSVLASSEIPNISLYANDGLVKRTDRLESWLLWPAGISSPGAMRQWGHHAIAFVGERYFDSTTLLDKYFDTVNNTKDIAKN